MGVLGSSHPPRQMDQARQVARLKHFSIRTEKSYLYYIHDFILFHNKQHPKNMGAAEIGTYLAHLTINKNVASTNRRNNLSQVHYASKKLSDAL
jgi:Phage integrase, N-terminal SAM-like domain